MMVCYRDGDHQAYAAGRGGLYSPDAKVQALKELLLLVPASKSDELVCCLDGWGTFSTKAESFHVFTVIHVAKSHPNDPQVQSYPYVVDEESHKLYWVNLGENFKPTRSIADPATKLLTKVFEIADNDMELIPVAHMLRERGHHVKL